MASASESKLGFWTLISIVISAQLGTGMFLIPSILAPFRTLGLVGWLISGVGAVLITGVFSFLCTKTSKVGGPHIYARMFFGEKVGFFVTWIYWCGAWACNPIIIATTVNYLMHLTGDLSFGYKLALEISLVLSLTLINTRGVKTSGNFELFMTILKVVPLIAVPIIAFNHINFDNFKELAPIDMSPLKAITAATILSFWGFVGLEGGTSPAGVVKNPRRTVPLAIIFGTAFVAIVCIANTFSIFGLINPSELEHIGAPYAQAMTILFGGGFDKLFGSIVALMCIGSLNAWVLFSGQIARSAADEGMMPKSFGKLNKNGAPSKALWVSAIGTIVILFVQKTPLIGDKIDKFLGIASDLYVVLYAMAVLAYIKFMKDSKIKSIPQILVTGLAFVFCALILTHTDPMNLIVLVGLLATGIPVYLRLKKQRKA